MKLLLVPCRPAAQPTESISLYTYLYGMEV